MTKLYKLDGQIATPVYDMIEWARHMQVTDRRVAEDLIEDFRVSTVFLGIDHNFSPSGDPLLFETMVFDANSEDVIMQRYFIWSEALQGHQRIIAIVKAQRDNAKQLSLAALKQLVLNKNHSSESNPDKP